MLRNLVIACLLLVAVIVPLVAVPAASIEVAAPRATANLERAATEIVAAITFVTLSLLRAPPVC